MTDQTLLTLSNLATAFGLIVAALGGYGSYHYQQKIKKTEDAMSNGKSAYGMPVDISGGNGGAAKAIDGGVALGGSGGRSGVGSGGAGGDAEASGAGSMSIGGDGGDSGRSDGRGGKGGDSPLKKLSPEYLKSWGLTGNEGYGQGGRGANSPEYDRSLKVLNSISAEYIKKHPNAKLEPMPGVLMPPVSWVNERLSQRRETFSVEFIDNGTDFLLHSNVKQ